MTRMRSIAITAGVVLAIAVSACGNGPPESSGGGGAVAGRSAANGLGSPATKVTATSADTFSPGTISVTTGQVIQWTVASDSVPHNVTFDSNSELTSPGSLGPGDTWQVEFTVPGTYPYHCTIHDGMTGQITVTAGSGGGSTSGSPSSSPASPSAAGASPSASSSP